MDRNDEFKKWMNKVEEAMSIEIVPGQSIDMQPESECDCGSWDCPVCFPDDEVAMQTTGVITPDNHEETCPQCGHNMGVEHGCDSGEESPLSYGMGILGEEDMTDDSLGDEDNEDLASQILYMQDMGLSKSQGRIDPIQLQVMSPDELKKIHAEVMGAVTEAEGGPVPKPKPKPTKYKEPDPFDGMDDLLNPTPAHPIANYDNPDDGEFNDVEDRPMELPRASAANTRRATQNIRPTDQMRQWMGRINPDAGDDEPDLVPREPNADLVVRTARDVPAVLGSDLIASGMQNPEWHTIDNLPGYMARNIRGMGRQVFRMFTRTPLEDIQTIANVQGQGPNTDAEMRAVAGWLRDNAEDMGEVKLDHGIAIPGYRPDVKEYRANGIRFHVVRDPMGQYIYAYPDADSTSHGAGQEPAQLQRNNLPGLRESNGMKVFKYSLMEQMQWDEEIEEALSQIDEEMIDESTLSRMIGKQKGGQLLVQWLHRKHKLSNEAELVPASFNERIFWKQFKSNPDDFVIVSAAGGTAGIKPSMEYIEHMRQKYAKKNKTYNPSGDANLQYQAIAFTDDGKQIDPKLLQAKPKPGEDDDGLAKDKDKFISADPTVIKARMGLHSGKDTQNADNIFNLLSDQIGTLRTVWISGFENVKDGEPGRGSVEREKMKTRAGYKADSAPMDESQAVTAVFRRIRPVLGRLVDQAYSHLFRTAQRYMNGGNDDAAAKVMASRQKLKQIMVNLDTAGDIALDAQWGSPTKTLADAINNALVAAAGAPVGSEDYIQYVNDAARGNAVALRPVLDSLRDTLVSIR